MCMWCVANLCAREVQQGLDIHIVGGQNQLEQQLLVNLPTRNRHAHASTIDSECVRWSPGS